MQSGSAVRLKLDYDGVKFLCSRRMFKLDLILLCSYDLMVVVATD